MSATVYKVIEVIGSSPISWEHAARAAVGTAARSVRDLRVGEITRMDYVPGRLAVGHGSSVPVRMFRVRMNLSFKYESG